MMSSLFDAAHEKRGLKKIWGYRLAIKSNSSVIDGSGVIDSAASLCESVKYPRERGGGL